MTVKGSPAIALTLPGALSKGDVVPLPLSASAGEDLNTENGGKKIPCSAATIASLVKQQPKAVILVTAGTELPAGKVARVVGLLQQNHAAANFLQLKAASADDVAKRNEAKEAVDKALEGAIGGMGGMGGDK